METDVSIDHVLNKLIAGLKVALVFPDKETAKAAYRKISVRKSYTRAKERALGMDMDYHDENLSTEYRNKDGRVVLILGLAPRKTTLAQFTMLDDPELLNG